MNEKMTLEEFFALADRVAGALDVLREARGLPTLTMPVDSGAKPFPQSHVGAEIRYVPSNHERIGGPFVQPVTNKGAVQWTPEELARKDALRAKQAATLPTDPVMDALEEGE